MHQQNSSLPKVFKWFGSRLALNIYFWVILFAIKAPDADDQSAYPHLFYYGMMVFYMLFFVSLSYLNNLLLLPRFLFSGKRSVYFLSAFVLVFAFSFVYTFMMKWIPMMIPHFDSMVVSIVMSPVSDNLSLLGILEDMQTYFAMMVLWLTIFTLLGYYHHSIAKMKSMEEAIHKHREVELSFLRNQINPHFLFNTLNNLYALTLKKSDEAPEAILKLSSVLRYVLYDAQADLVSFEKEQEIMQAYVDIELLRINDSPAIQFAISADKPYHIPPLIWLPVLENAFKHSRSATEHDIDFRFTIFNNKLSAFCKNNFAPTPTDGTKEGGIGLSNLRKRLELMYPAKHTIHTKTQQNYFIIEIEITLL